MPTNLRNPQFESPHSTNTPGRTSQLSESDSTKCPICGHVAGGHLCKPVPASTNKCPECGGKCYVTDHPMDAEEICSTCKGTGMDPEPALTRDELSERMELVLLDYLADPEHMVVPPIQKLHTLITKSQIAVLEKLEPLSWSDEHLDPVVNLSDIRDAITELKGKL